MQEQQLQVSTALQQILSAVLGPQYNFDDQTALLGAIPEFDSSSIMSILTMLEDQFDVIFADDELSAELFSSVGSLRRFVDEKLAHSV